MNPTSNIRDLYKALIVINSASSIDNDPMSFVLHYNTPTHILTS